MVKVQEHGIGGMGQRALALAIMVTSSVVTLAANWESGDGYRSLPLAVAPSTQVGFTQMDPALTGVYFTNMLSRARYTTNQIYLNGSGVTAGDVDGDGKVDLFFAGLDGKNRLYRNLGGWKFEEITDQAGVGAEGIASTGCAFADIDGDEDLDLLVNSVGQGTHLFTNGGKGNYTWQTRRRAPNAGKGGMSMALADVDGDGDLDLYLANYRTWTYRDRPKRRIRGNTVNGKPVVVSFDGRPTTAPDLVGRFSLTENNKIVENGEIDAFFLNDGAGRFKQVTFNGGMFLDASGNVWKERPFDWGLSVMFRDMNGDLAPDLYVCNDFSAPDRVWINDGGGKFQLMSALDLRNTSRFSMGIDFADIDRDGHDDFVVMDMLSRDHEMRMVQMGEALRPKERGDDLLNRPQFSRNTMYRNHGDGTYAEVAYHAGTHAAEWAWTPIFVDVDLDGFEDLLITNGHERDALNADVRGQIERQLQNPNISRNEILLLNNLYERLATPNVAFRNRGDFTFEDVSERWGFAKEEVSHGMALADLDNDGDQDVLVNNLNGVAGVFRNDGAGARVAVRLRGLKPNTGGIGAKIRFKGAPRSQSQEIILGGRYLSSDDPVRVFAIDPSETAAELEVTWRSGKVSKITGVSANRLYEISEAGAVAPGEVEAEEARPLFVDVSDQLGHIHREMPFDEFFRQRLLSRGLSELGPGVAWADLNLDGYDDLLVGSGRGGQMAVMMNDKGHGFKASSAGRINPPQSRDQTGIVTWQTSEGTTIAFGASNYEDGSASGAGLTVVAAEGTGRPKNLPASRSAAGPLAACDFDADGDMDLFVGGRVIAGQYPLAADSQLWLNQEGEWVESSWNATVFKGVGMVSGAVWSDLRSDGFPELILACEWGGIRIFENDVGVLKESTSDWGLDGALGWWHGIAAGDFDGDGRMDLVASNWGLNHAYQPVGAENLRWFSGASTAPNGPRFLVEGYVNEAQPEAVPLRGFGIYNASLPGVRNRFRSHSQFGKATVASVIGAEFSKYQTHRISTFAHKVFLNRGDHFESIPLPWLSQLAPAFAISVGDVDLDGVEDLFLSQNLFSVRPDMSRMDGGRGLLLLGDGSGGFRAVPGDRSGVIVHGEQRGAAFGDFDNDGRPDLVVSQNGAKTRLFRNQSDAQGLRVRLVAGEGNQTGIGAVIRGGMGDTWGPAREVHSGAGYWSQESAVQVLQPGYKKIQIRWPGGEPKEYEVPDGAKEVSISAIDGLTLLK